MKKQVARWLMILGSVTVTVLAVVAASYADSSKSSTFDSSDEGWRPGNDVNLSWQSSGGNPGGYLKGTDKGTGGWWYFVSPLDWAGDWRSYDTLSYDLKISGGTNDGTLKEIRIIGNNGQTLECDRPIPTTAWKTYTVALNAGTFGVSQTVYDGVMENVKELWIRGEFATGSDNAGLDNVMLTRQTPPVPEISTLLFLGLGLAGVVGLMVWRRYRDSDVTVQS